MGTATNAILAYGYDLGSVGGWRLEGTDKWGGPPRTSWFDPDVLTVDDDEGDLFITAMETRLADALGVDHSLELVPHCYIGEPSWILAAHRITAFRGDVEVINFRALADLQREEQWAAHRLTPALEALGIRPIQRQPTWLLVSFWG